MPTHNKLAVSIREAADLMSLSERAIYYLIRSGDIRSFKAGGRRLVRLDALDDFIERQELQAA